MTGRRKEPASSIRRYRCGPAPPDASRPRVIAQKVLLLCIPDNAVDEGDIEIAENRKRLIGDGGRDLLLRHHNQDTGILGDAPPLKPTPFKGKRRFFAAAQAPIGEPALLQLVDVADDVWDTGAPNIDISAGRILIDAGAIRIVLSVLGIDHLTAAEIPHLLGKFFILGPNIGLPILNPKGR